MELNKHVYAIQRIIGNGKPSDDKKFSNSFIAHLLKVNRAILLKRKMDKERYLNPSNRQLICLPMEEADYANCPNCNIPDLGCTLYRSVRELPSVIYNRSGTSYIVRNVLGDIINPYTLTNSKYSEFSYVDNSKEGWFISDQYLYLFNPIKLVIVDFIPEDPENIFELSGCDEVDPQTTPCIKSMVNEFPIDPDLINPMYKLTLEMVGISYKYPEDNLGNARAATIQEDKE